MLPMEFSLLCSIELYLQKEFKQCTTSLLNFISRPIQIFNILLLLLFLNTRIITDRLMEDDIQLCNHHQKKNYTIPSFTHFAFVRISLLKQAKSVGREEVWHGKRKRTRHQGTVEKFMLIPTRKQRHSLRELQPPAPAGCGNPCGRQELTQPPSKCTGKTSQSEG